MELEHGLGFKADTLNVGTSPRKGIHLFLAIGATEISAIRNGLEIDALQRTSRGARDKRTRIDKLAELADGVRLVNAVHVVVTQLGALGGANKSFHGCLLSRPCAGASAKESQKAVSSRHGNVGRDIRCREKLELKRGLVNVEEMEKREKRNQSTCNFSRYVSTLTASKKATLPSARRLP